MSYFAPPRRIETTVFTPAARQVPTPTPHPMERCQPGGKGGGPFLEGPSFDRQGRLYVTDIPFGRIFRILRTGSGSRSPNMTAGRTG